MLKEWKVKIKDNHCIAVQNNFVPPCNTPIRAITTNTTKAAGTMKPEPGSLSHNTPVFLATERQAREMRPILRLTAANARQIRRSLNDITFAVALVSVVYTVVRSLIRDILLNVFYKIPPAGGPIL